MATQVMEHIIQVIDELLWLLSCDEYADAEITWRLDWLHRVRSSLQAASSKEEKLEVIQEMRRVVKGGMGSFLDIHLSPKPECGLLETEMNIRFGKLCNELYMLWEQFAKELKEN